MAKVYTRITWVDELLAAAERMIMKDNAGATLFDNVQILLKTSVTTAGTPVNAFNMNHLEAGLDALDTKVDALYPIGAVAMWSGRVAPTNHLLCNGAAVLRATYPELVAAIMPTLGTFTVTIASPGVFTLNSHGLTTADAVFLTTTGALPTGLSANTLYYVTVVSSNTFKLATSRANARASTNINTSGTQSGVHSLTFCPWGLGNGSTTFNVPNLLGNVAVGLNSADTSFDVLGLTGGEKSHVLTTAELASHTHTQNSHNHVQDAHTHVQNSHNHTQDPHNHTQDPHTHTQNSHNHTQDSHTHPMLGRDSSTAGTQNRVMVASATGSVHDPDSGGTVATNQAATAVNQNATATNQSTTATNQAATAVNQNATATNQAATATNNNAGSDVAHNNLQPYVAMNYIIRAL